MKRAIVAMLGGYKRWLSPALPAACRFVPTCSEYASEAVERHGALRGTWLALLRLMRCHPLARAGYDPVPPEKSASHPCSHGGRDLRPFNGEQDAVRLGRPLLALDRKSMS